MTKTEHLRRLLKRQWVSPLECLELCGLMTLSQRCSEFKAAGMPLKKKPLKLASGTTVMSYRLGRK